MLNEIVKRTIPGVSIVTVCKNREESLKEVLPTWVKQKNIDEIVILDWSSDNSLKPLVDSFNDERIVLLDAPKQDKWILSHAYNLAIRMCSHANILKLDSDVKLMDDFISTHDLKQGIFFTGNWEKARDDNEKHLNGVLYIKKEDFLSINGYNEFIKTYGWDDSDLYNRLMTHGIEKHDINNDTVYHIPHNDSRTKHNHDHLNDFDLRDDAKAFLFTIKNKIICEQYVTWESKKIMDFKVQEVRKNYFICTQTNKDENTVSDEIMDLATYDALGDVLSWGKNDYDIKIPKKQICAYSKEQLLMIYAVLRPNVPSSKETSVLSSITWIDNDELKKSVFDTLIGLHSRTQNEYIDEIIILQGEQQKFPTILQKYIEKNNLFKIINMKKPLNRKNIFNYIQHSFDQKNVFVGSSRTNIARSEVSNFIKTEEATIGQLDNNSENTYLYNVHDLKICTDLKQECFKKKGAFMYYRTFAQKDQKVYNPFLDKLTKLYHKLSRTLFSKKHVSSKDEPSKKLYVHPQHGLANRLRAVASAWLLAEKANLDLVIIWEKDMHCNASFKELFKTPLVVIDSLNSINIDNCIIYNYMDDEEGSEKDKYIEHNIDKDIYVKSAYVLNHKYATWKDENIFLRKLVQVQDDIQAIINTYDVKDRIGVHIRQGGGKGHDTSAWNRPENWSQKGQDEMYYWREQSKPAVFIKKMHVILEKNPEATFYLATDEPESYTLMDEHFHDKLMYVTREVFDRSTEQQKFALIDIILLSKTKRMLGSNWSSFSEIANRIGGMPYEKSGIDFKG